MRRWLPAAASGALLVAALGLLEWATRAGFVSPFLVPPPSQIAIAGWRLALHGPLASAFFSTLLVTLVATAAAALVGIPAGWFMHRFRDYGIAYEAWAGALFSAPLILLYPLFLVVFGRSLFTLGVMGFLRWRHSGVAPDLPRLARRADSAGERCAFLQPKRARHFYEGAASRRTACRVHGAQAHVHLHHHQRRRARVSGQFRRPWFSGRQHVRPLRHSRNVCGGGVRPVG